MSTEVTYGVKGMTCRHCVSAVIEELSKLTGVLEVSVDLVAGGTSNVHVLGDGELDQAQVRHAVEEAGYELAESAA